MSASFAPTLSMLASEADLAKAGITLEEGQRQLRQFFNSVDLRQSVEFTAERLRVIATGEILENFSAMITAKFQRGGVPYLVIATGDVVEVSIELEVV